MIIKNNRIHMFANEIDPSINPRGIRGSRYNKKDARWSFPLGEMDRLLIKVKHFDIEEEWFDIFPDFKFLSRL